MATGDPLGHGPQWPAQIFTFGVNEPNVDFADTGPAKLRLPAVSANLSHGCPCQFACQYSLGHRSIPANLDSG